MTQFIELETYQSVTQCFNVDRIESFMPSSQDKETTTLCLIPDQNSDGIITIQMPYNDLKLLLNAAGVRCS